MVTAGIDLQGLQQELDGFKNRFEAWTQETVGAAESRRDEHFTRLRELQANIRDLEHQQRALQKRAQDVQQRLATEDAEVEALEHDIELIRREQSALPARLLEVKAVLDAETAAAATRTAAAQHQEQHKQRKLDALREALDCYKDRLALAFEHSDDDGECLNVVLTQVDPRNGDRPFFFAIQVLDGDLYNVQTCEPSVPNLPALVSQLNSSNDFSQFVRKLRQEFKALVAAEMKG